MAQGGSERERRLEELIRDLDGEPVEEIARRVQELEMRLDNAVNGTHPSLRDVTLAKTATSYIYPGRSGRSDDEREPSKLLYFGFNIDDLAKHSTFEETAYLIMNGHLPSQEELDDLSRKLQESRDIPSEVIDNIRMTIGRGDSSMAVLRTAVSMLSAFDEHYDPNDNSFETIVDTGIRLTSQVATIVAAYYRIKNGLEPVAPNKEHSHAKNFLYMLHEEEPSDKYVAMMDMDLILHAEHGSNASAFAARVTAGTAADLYSSIVTAIGTLKGPKHGGAAENISNLMNEIIPLNELPEYSDKEIRQRVSDYIDNLLANRGRVPGAGHAVYRAVDARAPHSKAVAMEEGDPKVLIMLEAIESKVENSKLAERGVHINVDFWTGVIYNKFGLSQDLYVPIFAVGRVPGWTRHIWEQTKLNQLIRPHLDYEGPMDLDYAVARAEVGRPLR